VGHEITGRKKKMMYKTRRLTEEENFLVDFAASAKKTTLELYDRLFGNIITISGVLISVNIASNAVYFPAFIMAWLSLLFSIAGILPIAKEVHPNFINEIRSFFDERIRFKKIIFRISLTFLFVSFALSSYSKIFF
jgi:hypothetical protein